VKTPPPPAEPVPAPETTQALFADSAGASNLHLTMTDVVGLALTRNPATHESWAIAQSDADLYGVARGALYPNINGNVILSRTSSSGGGAGGIGGIGGTGGTGTGGIDTTGTGRPAGAGGSGGNASSSRTVLTPSVSLSYLVFDFGGRSGSIEAAKQRAISSDLAHNATLNDVVLQTESSLFSFLATRSLRDAQITAVTEASADTAAAEARFRVGVGTLQEVLQTRTALAQARVQLSTLEGNLASARANLASAMGLPANAVFDVPAMATGDSVATVAASVDTLINRAITQRPEIAEARAAANALAAEIRIARSAGYPALTLSSSESFTRRLQGTATNGRNSSLQLGLQIPIFNGFARQYDVRSAQADYMAGMARLASTTLQITTQVYTSYAASQTATQRVQEAAELLTSAQQSSDVAVGRYREGVGTILDVLLARSSLEQARAEDIQARWEWRTALAQLAHDVGALDGAGRPNIPLGGAAPVIRR
jgi:outer membrane protein